jgi:hypothetical protein
LAGNWQRERRQKRGGGIPLVALDGLAAEERYRVEPSDGLTPESLFDRRWALALLDRVFAGLMAQGIAIWFGAQGFVNMGVNLGVLPTKGLTLPLMSYGGSAILMNLVAVALVLRVDMENRALMRGGRA